MIERARILVVEDESRMRKLLKKTLEEEGFGVDCADGTEEMERLLLQARFDLIVLDRFLGDEDALHFCPRLRETNLVIICSGLAGEDDRNAALEAGAHDFVGKSSDPRELLLRIGNLLKSATKPGRTYAFAGRRFDPVEREVQMPDGALVRLFPGLSDLLKVFVRNPGRVLTRQELLQELHKLDHPDRQPDDHSINVAVSRLRREIEIDAKNPELIKTVHARGYIFAPPVELL